jgi:hypothetical protein
LGDRPLAKAGDNTAQVVEATRAPPRARSEELVDEDRRELIEPARTVLLREAGEQAQLSLLAVVLAANCPAMGEEGLYG